jgi:hypothetical protein
MDSLLTDIKNVDKMVSYLIGGVMVSILALSVLDPWDKIFNYKEALQNINIEEYLKNPLTCDCSHSPFQ